MHWEQNHVTNYFLKSFMSSSENLAIIHPTDNNLLKIYLGLASWKTSFVVKEKKEMESNLGMKSVVS
jgi:hypothetical protein